MLRAYQRSLSFGKGSFEFSDHLQSDDFVAQIRLFTLCRYPYGISF